MERSSEGTTAALLSIISLSTTTKRAVNVLLLKLTDCALDAPLALEVGTLVVLLGDALLHDLEHISDEARPKHPIAGEEPRVLGREERGSFYFFKSERWNVGAAV
jgi:hypothetical protein